MDAIARLDTTDRRNLFASVAASPGAALPRPVAVEIIEKDAWVCFALERLFRLPLLRGDGQEPPIVFKGGTSLSKGYGLIRRFSEDVDLTIDPTLFGVRLAPSTATRSQQVKQLEAANGGCDSFVSGPLRDELEQDLGSALGGSDWVSVDADDPSTLLFAYPGPIGGTARYIPPTVRLEFGARSEREPWVMRPVLAYAAQARPDAGLGGAFDVPVLAAERTFWEKATLLHAENARARRSGEERATTGPRYSRHASDLASMADSGVVENAIADEALLRRVCDCKQARFRAAYVNYDHVYRDTIEVVPRGPLAIALAADYVAMRSMFFEDPPPWEAVLATLAGLEAKLRSSAAPTG